LTKGTVISRHRAAALTCPWIIHWSIYHPLSIQPKQEIMQSSELASPMAAPAAVKLFQ